MRVTLYIGVAIVVSLFGIAAAAPAAGQAPDAKLCGDAANPPTSPVVQGGCIAIARAKGNCQACHFVAGTASGNIAPPFAGMRQRFADKSRLRAQIEDPTRFNPQTVMPPFGKHEILTPDEIDKVIEWLLTL